MFSWQLPRNTHLAVAMRLQIALSIILCRGSLIIWLGNHRGTEHSIGRLVPNRRILCGKFPYPIFMLFTVMRIWNGDFCPYDLGNFVERIRLVFCVWKKFYLLDGTSPKCFFSNRFYRFGYFYSSKVITSIERPSPDACRTVVDGDGGQTWTFHVFANSFISIVYALNGRKVIT